MRSFFANAIRMSKLEADPVQRVIEAFAEALVRKLSWEGQGELLMVCGLLFVVADVVELLVTGGWFWVVDGRWL